MDYETPTNGFHPLWFLIITLFQLISTDALYITFVVTLIVFISHLSSIFLVRKLLISQQIMARTANYFAILVTSINLLYFAQGMEIIILFPLITILFIKIIDNDSNPFVLGLLFNLIFLTRLDSIFFLLLCFVYILINKRYLVKRGMFYVPFILSLIYILSNIILFDTLLPISGVAKQLKSSYMPVSTVFESVFVMQRDRIIYGGIPFVLFLSNYIILIIRKDKIVNSTLYLLVNSFPIMFLIYNSIFSGWYLWSWYFYIFFPSILIFALLIGKINILDSIISKVLPLIVMLVILFFGLATRKFIPINTLFYEHAITVSEFEKTHPGRYAIGDRAGLITYMIDSPVTHLEGLMMDRKYILKFKNSPPLSELLRDYKIDYYLANNALPLDSGYFVEEPTKFHEYMITSKDTLYQKPIIIEDRQGWKFHIFDLRQK